MGHSRTHQMVPVTAQTMWAGWLLLALLMVTFLIGGGARGDVNSVAILRPIAMLVGIIGLALLTKAKAQAFWPLLVMGVLIVVWIGVQLLPLPPSIIAAMPGQEPYVAAAKAMGVAESWRPLSVVPSQTSNAFYAAFVPLAALILFTATHGHFRRMALLGVIVFAIMSMLIGVLQFGVGADSPLYFYSITNTGFPVGLFANRNHQGILMACMPPLLAYLVITQRRMPNLPWLSLGLWLMMAIFVLALGSRAGLILFVVSSIAVFFMLPADAQAALPGPKALRGKMHFFYPIGIAVSFAGIISFASRTVAWQRLMESASENELRGDIVAPALKMIADFAPTGAGGGTFPYVYYRYEPTEMLRSAYVNHIHNDYLELMFEYGLPGVAIALFALAILMRAAWSAWRDKSNAESQVASRAAIIGLGVLLAGSAADYPLRVPSLACVAVVFAATLYRRRATA